MVYNSGNIHFAHEAAAWQSPTGPVHLCSAPHPLGLRLGLGLGHLKAHRLSGCWLWAGVLSWACGWDLHGTCILSMWLLDFLITQYWVSWTNALRDRESQVDALLHFIT